MITSQTLGTTLYPVSLGGHLVETAVEIARASATRFASGPDPAKLRALGADPAFLAFLDGLTSAPTPTPRT
ncbi:hypothetical protein [Streptomyces sp. S.PB5]|uniref:hypothetical protein n=1 Tax=Streptomyces sp. S.PB5 TaxID=3020844 RepID=UPI0025B21C9F|nr:hypothetical protein [Streptomyces sp. S.PB5]MDN3025977.1 hypothetical protein [Streptomyces sp. S.PB5]